jgi:hypothetical protein
MKRFHCLLIALLALLTSFALAESEARKSFDQLAKLEGNWTGKGSEGHTVNVIFRMTRADRR